MKKLFFHLMFLGLLIFSSETVFALRRWIPPQPAPQTTLRKFFSTACSDPDGGKNDGQKATTTGIHLDGTPVTATDSCYDPTVGLVASCSGANCHVEEYFCGVEGATPGELADVVYQMVPFCPYGCSDGQCNPEPVSAKPEAEPSSSCEEELAGLKQKIARLECELGCSSKTGIERLECSVRCASLAIRENPSRWE
jgi:hypothetical protein